MQANGGARDSPDLQPPPGVVELREDVPLKAGAVASEAGRWCAGGPRFVLGCFAALTVAVTVVPHGSVSSGAAACSRAGADALKRGGRALDAAVAAALCLAVLDPHRTSLDASGALLYWEYGQVRAQGATPEAVEWGGPGATAMRAPRLLAALAALHAGRGALPWADLLQPAIRLARGGFPVSEGLAVASAAEAAGGGAASPLAPGTIDTAPLLADYLESLQHNTSAELSSAWSSEGVLVRSTGVALDAGAWRLVAAGAGAALAGRALAAALQPPPSTVEDASERVIGALQREAAAAAWTPTGVATGLAVVDQHDTYVALVTGLSRPFGSGALQSGGWRADAPVAPLDLAPAIMVQQQVCGTRYVLGAESAAALAQGAAVLAVEGPLGAGAVERPRIALAPGGALLVEALRPTLAPASAAAGANASLPYAAVNVVRQQSDALLSHADSRGGGLAYRF
ncbi:hypothetical protein K1T71_002901 [Dendrolimus kikuchii]|uniref:Uncharacterized protein n=1 Tax=Dendrolimus kikuchii TaxID=765133 RepID=A0ACC1DDY9_9NEOP|nr:hypothetical protein K1T71_002901 [Dendrolimus kikuchii]